MERNCPDKLDVSSSRMAAGEAESPGGLEGGEPDVWRLWTNLLEIYVRNESNVSAITS